MKRSSYAWLAAASAIVAAGTAAAAGIATGQWSQHVRVMAGGIAMQTIDVQLCYGPADATDASRSHRVEKSLRRLIDPSCTASQEAGFDSERFSIACSGAAAGSGTATVHETDERTFSQHIDYRNEATGGIAMQYDVEAQWQAPECGVNP